MTYSLENLSFQLQESITESNNIRLEFNKLNSSLIEFRTINIPEQNQLKEKLKKNQLKKEKFLKEKEDILSSKESTIGQSILKKIKYAKDELDKENDKSTIIIKELKEKRKLLKEWRKKEGKVMIRVASLQLDEINSLERDIKKYKKRIEEITEEKVQLESKVKRRTSVKSQGKVKELRRLLQKSTRENNTLRRTLEELNEALFSGWSPEILDDLTESETSIPEMIRSASIRKSPKNLSSPSRPVKRSRSISLGGKISLKTNSSSPMRSTPPNIDIQEIIISSTRPKVLDSLENLDTLLVVPIAVSYFKEYLATEYTQENLLFWIDVTDFIQTCSTNEKRLKKIGKIIIDKFIRQGSLFEINIESKVREDLLLLSNNDFSINMFDIAKEQIYDFMNHNSFLPFKQTLLYKELESKIKKSGWEGDIQMEKTASLIPRCGTQEILNSIFKYHGKARNSLLVCKELFSKLLYLFSNFYSPSSKKINFHLISQSIPFKKFVDSTIELQRINIRKFKNENEKTSLFINLFNILYIHGGIINGFPTDKSSSLKFHSSTKYIIDAMEFSLMDIKHGILRCNREPGSKKIHPYFKGSDKRQKISLTLLDPRIHFALISFNCLSFDFKYFKAENLEKILEKNTSNRLSESIKIDYLNKYITLPDIFNEFSRDFAESNNEILYWVFNYITNEDFVVDYSIKFPKRKKIYESSIIIPSNVF